MEGQVVMWTGTTWMTGNMGISSGGTSMPATGIMRVWPWVGGQNLIGTVTYPVFAANRFGQAEAPENTIYAANLLWQNPAIESLGTRVIGETDLRLLSDGQLACSFSASATPSGGSNTAISALTSAQWNTVTVPSPLQGGAAQAAAFWDHPSYPTKSVARVWSPTRILMATCRESGTVQPLITWTLSNGATGSVIGVSESYTECKTMASSGMKAILKAPSGGYLGDGTMPTAAQAATGGLYGIMYPLSSITSARITEIKNINLKVWGYTANGAAVAQGYLDQGVNGLVTDEPVTTALAPIVPPPPVTGGNGSNTGTVFGLCSTESNSKGLLWPQYFGPTANGGAQPTPGVDRLYSGGSSVPMSWASNSRGVKAHWISWKPSLGSYTQASATADIKEITDGLVGKMDQHVFVAVHHEPEGLGNSAIPTWRQAHSYLYRAAVIARRSGYKVWVAPIICDWHFCRCHCWRWDGDVPNSGGAKYDVYYPANWLEYDVLGVDLYPEGQAGGNKDPYGENRIGRLSMMDDYVVRPYAVLTGVGQGQYDDTNNCGKIPKGVISSSLADCVDASPKYPKVGEWELIRTISKYAKSLGKHWGTGETGIVHGNSGTAVGRGGTRDTQFLYTLAQRAQRSTDMANDLQTVDHPALLWCWYDDGGCNATAEGDMASINAWRNSIRTNISLPDDIFDLMA